jgi:hypothetical protein
MAGKSDSLPYLKGASQEFIDATDLVFATESGA